MAMALELALNIPLSLGYLFSALIILPLVIKGIGYINKVQAISQPIWITLLLLPWVFVLFKHPDIIQEATHFVGENPIVSDLISYFRCSHHDLICINHPNRGTS